jgi:hypothetical protein
MKLSINLLDGQNVNILLELSMSSLPTTAAPMNISLFNSATSALSLINGRSSNASATIIPAL